MTALATLDAEKDSFCCQKIDVALNVMQKR